MSFLSHMFHRHSNQSTDLVSETSIEWVGQSGTAYPYEIHSLDAEFPAVPGNYIYAGKAEDGSWVPLYIAQTRALSQRLEGHVTTADAAAQGATHIHVHVSNTGQGARCSEEHDLVQQWHPVCNETE